MGYKNWSANFVVAQCVNRWYDHRGYFAFLVRLNQMRKAGLKMNSLVNMLEPSHAETDVVLDTGPPGVMEGEGA